MPPRAHPALPPFHRNRPGLVAPVPIDPLGITGPTPGQARGPHWRRTSRGLFVPANTDVNGVDQRILEAAAVLPEVAGITGWAALRWLGGLWFDGLDRGRSPLPVDLATSYADICSQRGFVVHQERLDPLDLVVWDGVRATSAVRSVCFMMRYARDVRAATQVADQAAFSDLVSIKECHEYFSAHPGWTGIPQARDALLLARENSWSPWETWMRILWQSDAGFPPPLCNRPIFDRAGNHVATPDILEVESGTVGEYDGSLHLLGEQRSRDLGRENRMRNFGLEPFTLLASDISNPAGAVQRMTDARRRARWEAESKRQWTIEPPPWWTPTYTVEQRRQLTADQRARFLRHRAS